VTPCSDPPAGTPLVYRWPDESTVSLRFLRCASSGGPWRVGEGVVQLLVRYRLRDYSPMLPPAGPAFGVAVLCPGVVEGPVLYVQNESLPSVEKPVRPTTRPASENVQGLSKKLRGLVLDMGADRCFRSDVGLLPTHRHDQHRHNQTSAVPMPRWVPDEEWDLRLQIAERYVVGVMGRTSTATLLAAKDLPPFLGWIPGLTLQTEHPGATTHAYNAADQRLVGLEEARLRGNLATRWHAHASGGSGSSSNSVHYTGWSLEEVVKTMLDVEGLVPTSRQARWEAENVERGEFVLPTGDEVELFRALGERLPFFWGYEGLRSFVLERAAGDAA